MGTRRIPVTTDLDLALTLFSGQVFRWRRHGTSFLGVDGPSWYSLKAEKGQLQAETNATEVELRRFLALDDPALATLRSQAPELRERLDWIQGARLVRPSDPLEALCSFLCTSNNNLARIQGMVEWLAALGEPLAEVDGTVLTRWPRANRLARVSEGELRAAGFGYRAKTMPAVFRFLAESDWEEQWPRLGYRELHSRLTLLPGVGPKLADCMALYAFHRPEAVPTDTHLWHAAASVYCPEWLAEAPTDRRKREIAELLRDHFGDLAAHAQFVLYLSRQRGFPDRVSPQN